MNNLRLWKAFESNLRQVILIRGNHCRYPVKGIGMHIIVEMDSMLCVCDMIKFILSNKAFKFNLL
ncbi:hypothetical protein A3F34_02055 [Candidatus Roizmanbacteria bacterium RIFCSPHIGHO2_12_FULL_44_10]|uniref:Uncharacterized protein n=1 Tax=Candidatus Roizmanbacteria bacterium RIFCSPHIGHO2_12_FULL_44_10 TaxID=1802054 RepID=A0A1F7I6K7_9BACT|nr:MAG: hypothetical protein A3F34_02055 [Candidatus Roizmanbacteria bacterium RIFCSPHIGHO2_12_FULL_44_10]